MDNLTKYLVWEQFNDNTITKAQLARDYNTSPRTIGRAISYIESLSDVELDALSQDMANDSVSVEEPEIADNTNGTDEKLATGYTGFDDDPIDDPIDVQFIKTGSSIIVYFSNDNEPTIIDNTHDSYTELNDLLHIGCKPDAKQIKKLVSVGSAIEEYYGSNVTYQNRSLIYVDDDGNELQMDSGLMNHIIKMFDNGIEPTASLNFISRLMKNPSNNSIKQVYRFVSHCDLPITPDGYIIAYKKIRHDWLDCYSKTIDNGIGQKPKVNRNQVDENMNVTCSYGLHLCAKSYLSLYSGDRVVACKLDPADIVSVPTDYSDAKLRCCEYEVVAELGMNGNLPDHYITYDELDGLNVVDINIDKKENE